MSAFTQRKYLSYIPMLTLCVWAVGCATVRPDGNQDLGLRDQNPEMVNIRKAPELTKDAADSVFYLQILVTAIVEVLR